jgi:cation transport ATPase
MRNRLQGVVASLLAVFSSVFLGIGVPPSEFAPTDSLWWMLEFLMWPALFGGVALAVAAFVASCLPWSTRVAALLCIAALTSTTIGIVVAAGISAMYGLREAVFDAVVIGLPSLLAFDTFRRSRRSVHRGLDNVVEGRTG